MRPLERHRQHIRPDRTIPTVGSQVLGRTIATIVDRFIDHIPPKDLPFVMSDYGCDMLMEPLHHDFARRRLTISSLKEPLAGLRMPDQGVAPHLDVVLLAPL